MRSQGDPSDGVMSLADIFRSFMNGSSILTRAGTDPFGNPVEPLTNWTDCGQLECLPFDDVNLTQAHIDLAGTRLTDARAVDFLRWTSSDRAFHPVVGAEGTGPLGGTLSPNGTWEDAVWVSGRWVAASSWLVVQLDRKELEADGWTTVWSDARQETSISLSDGFRVSGFRLEEQGLVPHPPNYTSELCLESAARGAPCSIEWSMNHMEGSLRSLDGHTVTLFARSSGQCRVEPGIAGISLPDRRHGVGHHRPPSAKSAEMVRCGHRRPRSRIGLALDAGHDRTSGLGDKCDRMEPHRTVTILQPPAHPRPRTWHR